MAGEETRYNNTKGFFMKIFTAAAVAVGFSFSAATAGDLADACVAALEAEGRDTSGCSCLESEIEGNDALVEEFMALGNVGDADERYEAASDEAKAAMDACTR